MPKENPTITVEDHNGISEIGTMANMVVYGNGSRPISRRNSIYDESHLTTTHQRDNLTTESPSLNSEEDLSNLHQNDHPTELLVDPFKHRLTLTKLQWLRVYILSLLLIPIRFVLILITFLIAELVASVALWNLSEEMKTEKPIASYWRKVAQQIVACLGRTGFRCCGFSVTVKGKMASAKEAPILVAAPHSGFFDTFVPFWSKTPSGVIREENRKLPVLSKCFDLFQSIYVKREDPYSRQGTVEEIVRRTNLSSHPDPAERWPQLFIFPEGSCSNRKALMSFKLGAFYPGKPVQPVLIRYPNDIDTVTWTWNQPHGAISVLWTTLAQPFTRAEIEFLPVYYPSPAEQKDPKLYASNVRDLMAADLKIPTSEMTFEEVKSRYAKHNKNESLSDPEKKKNE